MLRRFQAWMRTHRRNYRSISAEVDRLRAQDHGEMHHHDDRATVEEWGGMGP